ncbi:MAG: pimeloyl-CoA dehydrogenase large subunit [Alphaproteobacteria bacterium]|nr:MAG: pimeloyl-CoA dehydrogenase large subunit [Alphaproteobacteria bacterium]
MDLNLSLQDLQFRDEVRAFLAAHYPPEMAKAMRLGVPISKPDIVAWWATLDDHGFAAPAWPEEFGGRGLSLTQRHIFDMECRLGNCPPILPQNIAMIGPALLRFGTEAQKGRFLPQTRRGEIWWAQGYSENGAGSDLAAVAMKAERGGDSYIVNGAKTWTTAAEDADWIFCLTRTDPSVQRQKGITFLMIDMRSPGVRVEPIYGMNGQRLWNSVHFEDVRVPVENRLGEENAGWTVAKALLGDERIFVSRVSMSTQLLQHLKEVARVERADGQRLIDEPDFAKMISALDLRIQALDMMGLRLLAEAEARGGDVGARPSAMKALGSPLVQAVDTALTEAIAYYAAPDNHTAWEAGANVQGVGPDYAHAIAYNMLHHRGYSIAGGTTEIQKNIIAKQILGL